MKYSGLGVFNDSQDNEGRKTKEAGGVCGGKNLNMKEPGTKE